MKKKTSLSLQQLKIMDALWTLGEATVVGIQEILDKKTKLARNTVATMLSRLEKQGLISHKEKGRAYLYFPLTTREETQQSMISSMLEILFGGGKTELVSQILSNTDLDADEIKTVEKMLSDHKKKKGKK